MPKIQVLAVIAIGEKTYLPGDTLEVTAKQAKDLEKAVENWAIPVFEKIADTKENTVDTEETNADTEALEKEGDK